MCLTGSRCLLTFCDGRCLGTECLIHQTQKRRIASLLGELSSQFLDGSDFPSNIISTWRAKRSLSDQFFASSPASLSIKDFQRQLPQSLGNEAAELVDQVGIGCPTWNVGWRLTMGRFSGIEDKFTGKTMDRPGMEKLLADLRAGLVERIVVWRLDRLGRTTRGLCQLFDELGERKVDLVSLKDGFSLGFPRWSAPRPHLGIVAEYETEVRAERVAAGQAVARRKGKEVGRHQARLAVEGQRTIK